MVLLPWKSEVDSLDVRAPLARAVHVTSTRHGTDTVLLDLKRGQYHTLNEVGGRMWQLLESPMTCNDLVRANCDEYVGQSDATEQEVTEATLALVGEMRQMGLVEVAARMERPRAAVPTNPAGERRPRVALMRRPSALRCGLYVLAVRLALKTVGLQRTAIWIRDRVASVPIQAEPETRARVEVVATEYAVALASAFFPGRALCLEQSLVLYYLLRRQGRRAEFRVGVVPHPFMAHAWVEWGGAPVNDIVEHLQPFALMPVGIL